MLINDLPRYEILDEAALAELERGWRRIVSELGIEFLHPEALEVFESAGQQVEGELVRFDPDWILDQVAKAPPEFDLQARNPERSVHIGGNHMVFSAVYGCPFVREGDERRDATYDDFQNLVKEVAMHIAAADPKWVRREDVPRRADDGPLHPQLHGAVMELGFGPGGQEVPQERAHGRLQTAGAKLGVLDALPLRSTFAEDSAANSLPSISSLITRGTK